MREGQRAGHDLIDRARAIHSLPILATALDRTAWLEIAVGNDAAAVELGYETARVAAEVRDYRLVSSGMRRVAYALGFDLQRFDAADVAFESAAAAATLAGNPGDILAPLYSDREQVLYQRGDYLMLLPLAQMELALSVRLHGPDSYQAAVSLGDLARAMQALGPSVAADRLSSTALASAERILGPQHPVVLEILDYVGLSHLDAFDFDGAAPFFERELAAYESLLGGDDSGVAVAAHNLAVARRGERRLAEARALLRRALEIRTRRLGLDHPLLAATIAEMAEIDRLEGRTDDALDELGRAAAIDKRTDSSLQLARVYCTEGSVYLQLGRLAEARAALTAAENALARSPTDFVERARFLELSGDVLAAEGHPQTAVTAYAAAIRRLEMRYGASSPRLVDPLAGRGLAEVAAGEIAAAEADAARADAIAGSAPAPADRRAVSQLLLAQIEWAKGDRPGALALARRAREQVASLHYGSYVIVEIDRWLAREPKRPVRSGTEGSR